jgi:hypothetical protein
VSFGKDYVIRLPAAAHGWAGVEPGPGALCLVVTSDALYFRADCGLRPEEYVPCLVDAKDGKVRYGWKPSIAAYAVQWEIAINDPPHGLRTILQVQPTTTAGTTRS